ncbi:unnamed protein product [Sphenostylis stenocarpa]|uniref:Uncharacterized protein n=1 Tax=Sphenostylis stenocarpa TaxID=92480 RepID=A0AA86TAV3_9FABA|nr:unnamed protein product [Sphenostylis stenocarpa]
MSFFSSLFNCLVSSSSSSSCKRVSDIEHGRESKAPSSEKQKSKSKSKGTPVVHEQLCLPIPIAALID